MLRGPSPSRSLAALAPLTAGCDGQEPARAGATPRAATESGRAHHFDVRRVAEGLNRPTWVGAAPGDAGALWVLEQPGRVVRVHDGRRDVALDLRRRVRTGTEQGLLGIAFHPDFATNRLLYLHWSDRAGDTRVAEHRAAGGPPDDRATARARAARTSASPRRTTTAASSPSARTAACTSGSATAAARSTRGAQRRTRAACWASCWPLDVDRGEPRWEVVLTGLRNPWRFSFDNALGEVWVADVGQDDTEEVNRVLLEPDEPPKNLGWSVFEGTRRLEGHRREGPGELVFPAATYTHADGCSVTGGVVYGGAALPRLSRRYVYGDFCSGTLWSLRAAPGKGAADVRREAPRPAAHARRHGRRRRARPGLGGRRGLPRGARRLLSQRAHGAVDPRGLGRLRATSRRPAAGCAGAGRWPARARRADRDRRTSGRRPRRRRRARWRRRRRADGHRLGPHDDLNATGGTGVDRQAPELAHDDAVAPVAGQQVCLAQELGDPAAGRAAVDLLGRALLLDAP